ncbi:MAG TPA: sigma-70 family RNA polymerase sigma factor [Candidatus Paceibacterota bacterium]
MNTCTDAELIEKYRYYNDGAAFLELMDRYKNGLMNALIMRVGSDIDSAKDLLQDVYVKLLQELSIEGRYTERGNFGGYAYRITLNHFNTYWRRSGRHTADSLDEMQEMGNFFECSLPHSMVGPEAMLIIKETYRIVQIFIEKLPEHFRTIVMMRYYEGLQYNEIATELKIPLGTVKTRIFLFRQRLENAMNELHAESSLLSA